MENLIERFDLEKIEDKDKETQRPSGRYELKIYHDETAWDEYPRDWHGRSITLVELYDHDISIADEKLGDIMLDESENLNDDDQATLRDEAKRQAGPYGLAVGYVLEDWRNYGRCFVADDGDNVSGYVTMSRKQLKEERLTKKEARRTIESMLKQIDQYMQGNVYLAVVNHITECDHGHEHEDSIDSLGGIMIKDRIDCNEILEFMGLNKEYEEA